MNPTKKKTVCLYGLYQLGLIILCESGITYYNQAGGTACMQPEEEGVLTIVSDDLDEIGTDIAKETLDLMYLTEEKANKLDNILQKHLSTSFLRIDRKRLKDSMEAWLYVEIINDEVEQSNRDFEGFNETMGVLTWSNSD